MTHLRSAILMTIALACAAASGTGGAEARSARPPASMAVPERLVIPPDDYRGPDGAYGSTADMVRSIEGTPCGQTCQVRSFQRWNPPGGRD